MTNITEDIHPSISTENLEEHLKWFSKVRRDTGGPGEHEAAEYITQKLIEYGATVKVHEFDLFLSYPIKATLEVLGKEVISIPCLTHSFCASTGPEGITHELTYSPEGDATKTKGSISLFDGLLSPLKVKTASELGAKALIFANEDRVIHNMPGTTIWGTPTFDEIDRLPNIPVISISAEGSNKLKKLMKEQSITVRIVTEVETGWHTSKLPEAIIEGTGKTDEFILAGSHYCAWEVGVTDNATGNALLLEMARLLIKDRSNLKRDIRLCWWPGHSHGRYAGSTWYADTFFNNLSKNCVVYHNIDSPGVKGANRYIARHTSSEMEDFCKESIAAFADQPEIPVTRPTRGADQSFVNLGVPSFCCYSYLPIDHDDHRAWPGGCGDAWWWHTSEDTLDKADPNVLATDAKISITAVAKLANISVLPINLIRLANDFQSFVSEFTLQAGNHVDCDLIQQRTQRFLTICDEFSKKINKFEDNELPKVINETLMHVSRVTSNLLYSKFNRYSHDPAEKLPMVGTSNAISCPGLSEASELDRLSGTREYGFLTTQIIRQMNRFNSTLEEAIKVCGNALEILEDDE